MGKTPGGDWRRIRRRSVGVAVRVRGPGEEAGTGKSTRAQPGGTAEIRNRGTAAAEAFTTGDGMAPAADPRRYSLPDRRSQSEIRFRRGELQSRTPGGRAARF